MNLLVGVVLRAAQFQVRPAPVHPPFHPLAQRRVLQLQVIQAHLAGFAQHDLGLLHRDHRAVVLQRVAGLVDAHHPEHAVKDAHRVAQVFLQRLGRRRPQDQRFARARSASRSSSPTPSTIWKRPSAKLSAG